MINEHQNNLEKASVLTNIIAFAIVMALIGNFTYQAYFETWIIKCATFSAQKQNLQHQKEELEAMHSSSSI